MQNTLCILMLVLCLAAAALPVSAQEADPVVTWQVVINQARLDEGLSPYGFSSLLTAAAQRHADDVAARGFTDPGDVHKGSDGTHEQQRITEAGYAAWTWSSGEPIVDENVWSGYGTIQDALAFFLGDPPHRQNILSTVYREIGVGVATDAAGRVYYVLDFGVRPNVLPIFINDGAASTADPQIAIRLTNEEARPEGQGATFMGRAIEIRISDAPDFDDQPWQAWGALVPWTLPDVPGEYTVYVQFRDAASRTAASADTIVLSEGTTGTPASVSSTSTPSPTATPIPPTATPIPPTATPPPTVAPTAAATPAPTATPTPEALPTVAPTATSPGPAALSSGATPFPTWTPLPTAAPPPQSSAPVPAWALPVVLGLQGLALVLGIAFVLWRGRGQQDKAT
jgi:hypothetical protein